jgi:hypothetical protein
MTLENNVIRDNHRWNVHATEVIKLLLTDVLYLFEHVVVIYLFSGFLYFMGRSDGFLYLAPVLHRVVMDLLSFFLMFIYRIEWCLSRLLEDIKCLWPFGNTISL